MVALSPVVRFQIPLHRFQVFLITDFIEYLPDIDMALRQQADFFADIGQCTFHVFPIEAFIFQRRVCVDSVVQFAEDAPVIDNKAVILAFKKPVHTSDVLCSLRRLSRYSTVFLGVSKPVSNLSTTIKISGSSECLKAAIILS